MVHGPRREMVPALIALFFFEVSQAVRPRGTIQALDLGGLCRANKDKRYKYLSGRRRKISATKNTFF
jgi:hypothetical protein